jgi:hypothetical protein
VRRCACGDGGQCALGLWQGTRTDRRWPCGQLVFLDGILLVSEREGGIGYALEVVLVIQRCSDGSESNA